MTAAIFVVALTSVAKGTGTTLFVGVPSGASTFAAIQADDLTSETMFLRVRSMFARNLLVLI